MTSFDSILRDIYNASLTVKNQDEVDRTIAGAITYKVITDAIQSIPQSTFYLASIHYKNIYNQIQGIKESTVSYRMMNYYVKRIKKTILTLNQSEINYINSLFSDKTVIPQFNPDYFTPEMYSISSIRYPDTRFLKYAHERVMVPIAKFYIDIVGIMPNAVKILDALGESSVPGKYIYFIIDGIPSPKILSDIQHKIPSILNYIHDVVIDGTCVILSLK